MKNISSRHNLGIFTTFIFLLLCSGCGHTNEPASKTEPTTNTETSSFTEPVTNTEPTTKTETSSITEPVTNTAPTIDAENKAIEAIRAFVRNVDLDDTSRFFFYRYQ